MGNPIFPSRLNSAVDGLVAAAESSTPTMSKQIWLYHISFGFAVGLDLDATPLLLVSRIFMYTIKN